MFKEFFGIKKASPEEEKIEFKVGDRVIASGLGGKKDRIAIGEEMIFDWWKGTIEKPINEEGKITIRGESGNLIEVGPKDLKYFNLLEEEHEEPIKENQKEEQPVETPKSKQILDGGKHGWKPMRESPRGIGQPRW